MNKNDFILGENIKFDIYEYDDRGTEYIKTKEGKVIQKTNSFVVIDNGKYKESFKYSQFEKCIPGNVEGEPYDQCLENYKGDVINKCLEDFKNVGEGYVFNFDQLNEVIRKIATNKFITREENNIYYIKKI